MKLSLTYLEAINEMCLLTWQIDSKESLSKESGQELKHNVNIMSLRIVSRVMGKAKKEIPLPGEVKKSGGRH